MTIIQGVCNYYEENGISPKHFTCTHKVDCRADCSDFTGPKEPHIGSKYELGRCPRILFLSLDSGLGQKEPCRRSAPAVREWAESLNVEACPKGRHWYVTHEMAAELLKAYKPGLRLNNVAPYFAHINAAKCCQNKAGHAQADAILFRNCSEYIGGELKILRPDVLVTQGRYALTAVEQALQERKISSLRPLTWITSQKGAYGILAIGGRKVLWFATPHPQARGRIFQSQRERYWEKWSSMVGDLELVLKGAS